MTIDEIVSTFKQVPADSSLYLILALSDCAGVFADNGRLAYLVQNGEGLAFECIETEYLSLKTNVHIHAVKNAQTFKDDYYNLIVFKGSIEDTNLETFLKLCTLHSNNLNELRFKDFFYSLISLFQLPAEQQFKNALGLYGELKFMQYIWGKVGKDISTYWHKSGSMSKYDFTLGDIHFEVKSSLSNELIVSIKHAQIFCEHTCYLVVVRCERCDNGETIQDLVNTFASTPDAFNNLNFGINLQKELCRLSPIDVTTLQFSVIGIDIFDTVELNPFPDLPSRVSKISYLLDVSDKPTLSASDIMQIIGNETP